MRDKLELGNEVTVLLQVEVNGEKFEKIKRGFITEVRVYFGDSGEVLRRYTASDGKPQEWYSPKVLLKDAELSAFGITEGET